MLNYRIKVNINISFKLNMRKKIIDSEKSHTKHSNKGTLSKLKITGNMIRLRYSSIMVSWVSYVEPLEYEVSEYE